MRFTLTLLFVLAATFAAHAQHQSAVITDTQGDKVYIRVDPLLLRGDLDTLFASLGDLQDQIDNLSWADVLENGTTPGVDVDFFGYDAIGIGQVTTTGTFTGDSLVLNKDASIAGRMDVTGVVSFNDSLFVEGTVVLSDSLRVVQAVSMGSRLHVTGVTALGDSVHIVGNVDLDALFNVDGAATFGSTVNVSGETTLSDTLHVNAPALFSDSLDVSGNAHLGAQLAVDGATALGSSLAVSGASTLSSTLSVAGEATFADSLIANDGADFNSTLNVDGATTLNGTTVDGNLDLNGNADVSGTLDVGGATALAAALNVTGVTTLSDTLHVVSATMLDDSLRVGGNTRLTQDLWVDGNTNIGGTVNITGATSLGGPLSVSGVTSLGDSLHVAGGADFDGDVNVDGGTTTGTLNVTNTATFGGPSTFNDAATFGDSIFVNAPATFSDTAVFTGGAHITGGLNLDELVLNGVSIPALDNTDALPEGDSNLYFTADREAALQAQIDLQDSLNAVLTAVLDNLLNQLYDPATVTTSAASPVSAFTASLNAVFSDGGAEVEDSGFEFSTNSNLSDSTVYAASGAGSLVEALTGLTKGTTYYYRAFVETIMGRAVGSIQSFTTINDPQVSTQSATNVAITTATLNGTIVSNGGGTVSAKGFQYGTNSSFSGAANVSGSGSGSTFSANVTGLSGATTYHARAYATNEAGTVYGSSTSFTTDPLGPCEGATTLTYDGHTYGLVEVNNQCWFNEDLVATNIANLIGNIVDWTQYTNIVDLPNPNATDKIIRHSFNGGHLYSIDLITNACPSGWHIPSVQDLENVHFLRNPFTDPLPPAVLNMPDQHTTGYIKYLSSWLEYPSYLESTTNGTTPGAYYYGYVRCIKN